MQFTLKMEGLKSSEALIYYSNTTQHQNPKTLTWILRIFLAVSVFSYKIIDDFITNFVNFSLFIKFWNYYLYIVEGYKN